MFKFFKWLFFRKESSSDVIKREVEEYKQHSEEVNPPELIPEEASSFYEESYKRGWRLLDVQEGCKMLSILRNGVRLNYYYTTGTVATAMNHPKKGRSQLYRKGLSWDEILSVLDNPREHTNAGYYKK